MKMFKNLQKIFRIQFIDLHQHTDHFALGWGNYLIVFLIGQLTVSAFSYLCFGANSNFERGDSYYMFSCGLACMNHYLTYFKRKPETFELIETYDELIERRTNNPISKCLYKKLDDKIENLSKIIFVAFIPFTTLGVFLPYLFITLFNYFTLDLQEDAFILPYYMMYPFDWKSPIGYLIAFLSQLTGTFCYNLTSTPVMTLFIGSCWCVSTFVEDITYDLFCLTINSGNIKGLITRIHIFHDIIQFHIDIRRLTDKVNYIQEHLVTGALFWSLLAICSSLLVFQSEISEDGLFQIEIMHSLFEMFWAFTVVFVFCEFGGNVSNQFDKFNDELCNCEWYLFPLEMQRIMIIFMMNAQQPVVIYGFGNIVCNRETFKKTVNAGFSYYMMIRKISG